MSASNPQIKDCESILDKITEGLAASWSMVEIAITISIAAVCGLSTLTNRLYNRINELDRRIDSVELRVAEQYVSKADLEGMIDRVEGHLIRLENKLDKLSYRWINSYNN